MIKKLEKILCLWQNQRYWTGWMMDSSWVWIFITMRDKVARSVTELYHPCVGITTIIYRCPDNVTSAVGGRIPVSSYFSDKVRPTVDERAPSTYGKKNLRRRNPLGLHVRLSYFHPGNSKEAAPVLHFHGIDAFWLWFVSAQRKIEKTRDLPNRTFTPQLIVRCLATIGGITFSSICAIITWKLALKIVAQLNKLLLSLK